MIGMSLLTFAPYMINLIGIESALIVAIIGSQMMDWGLEISCSVFLTISHFLEQILMEHIGMKNHLDSKLQIDSIFSIGIRSRNRDIVKKPSQHISDLYEH